MQLHGSSKSKPRGGEPSGWDSLRRAYTDGAGDHRSAYLIRTEIVDALNRQQFRKLTRVAPLQFFEAIVGGFVSAYRSSKVLQQIQMP
jgi:hypothetical protein